MLVSLRVHNREKLYDFLNLNEESLKNIPQSCTAILFRTKTNHKIYQSQSLEETYKPGATGKLP